LLDDVYTDHKEALDQGDLGKIYDALKSVEVASLKLANNSIIIKK